MTEITAEEFERRLINICTGNDLRFPRKEKDRHVMLVAASRSFEKGMIYTEKEIDAAIRDWLENGCPALTIDEVTLRRELIDASYLLRDDAGRFYAVGPGPASISFSPDVASVDPIQVIERAVTIRVERKQARIQDESSFRNAPDASPRGR